MHSWTPEQWATLVTAAVAAVAAAVVSVIDAVHGHLDREKMQKTINQVKAKQAEK